MSTVKWGRKWKISSRNKMLNRAGNNDVYIAFFIHVFVIVSGYERECQCQVDELNGEGGKRFCGFRHKLVRFFTGNNLGKGKRSAWKLIIGVVRQLCVSVRLNDFR